MPAKLQSYEPIHAYFVASQWVLLQSMRDDHDVKMHLLLDQCIRLGLRNPREPTYQMLAALLLVASYSLGSIRGMDKAMQASISQSLPDNKDTMRVARGNTISSHV